MPTKDGTQMESADALARQSAERELNTAVLAVMESEKSLRLARARERAARAALARLGASHT